MKPITTRPVIRDRLVVRLAWFVAIWTMSVGALSVVAYVLHKMIIG